jgi:hypothetical protein
VTPSLNGLLDSNQYDENREPALQSYVR